MKYIFPILPIAIYPVDYCSMTAPRVMEQFLQLADHSGSQWIEMDIADQFQKIRLLFADNRFIAVLKQMPIPKVTAIVEDCVAGQKLSHKYGEARSPVFQQQMSMVGHECPCVDFCTCCCSCNTQTRYEQMTIIIIFHNPVSLDSPHHHMMQGSR